MGLTMTTMTIVARPVPTARDTEMVALPKGAVTTGAMGATTIETTGVVVSAERRSPHFRQTACFRFRGEYTEANVIAEAHNT